VSRGAASAASFQYSTVLESQYIISTPKPFAGSSGLRSFSVPSG